MRKRPSMMEPLDKNGFIPLYHQIQESLLERIRRGDLKDGDLLESEEELSRRYHVSRMTARQALQSLKIKGYAISERGRGTFVTTPKLMKSILQLRSFTEELRKKGITPSSKMLQQKVVRASGELCSTLKLDDNENVLHLRRLRLANNIPLAVEDSHVVLKPFPGLELIDFSNRSLYQTLRDRYRVKFGWADEVIEALPAIKAEAELLNVRRGSSLLCITRTLMSADEMPLEFAVSHYRGDRYRASLRVPMLFEDPNPEN